MKLSIIVGTRPEIIKMAPIIRECKRLKQGFSILHTGQHYSYNMDKIFFEQLELPSPDYNLDVGSGLHGEQTAKILTGIETKLLQVKPDIVLVEGDTNTVVAGAIAATKLHIPVGHVEAGLRSYDRQMPEEINRILTDHCSDFLFAPTDISRSILLKEGIASEQIYVTGNTIVDSVLQNQELAHNKTDALQKMQLIKNQYFLVTTHRQENVDNQDRFRNIIKGLTLLSNEYNMPIIYSIHPRSRRKLEEFSLSSESIRIIDPIDYFSFLQLESNAHVILTDSGGVQEEACVLGTPCVTLRDNTERPETIEVGANILAGTNPNDIVTSVAEMSKQKGTWTNPFGDGTAGKQIVSILRNKQ